MGYEDDIDRSGNRRSRARQSAGHGREMEEQRYRESGHSQSGLNLITDTFGDEGGRRGGTERGSHGGPGRDRSGHGRPESDNQKKSRGRKEAPAGRQKKRRNEPERDSGIYCTPAKKRAKKRKRKIMVILLEVVVLMSVIAFAAYSYVDRRLSGMSRLDWNPDAIKNIEISEEKQEQMKGYWTIAVFGVDSRNSSVGKGNNSDVNMVCNVNMDTGEIKLVSVYRDTYLNISDKNSYNKMNAAYLQGGPEQAVKALNKNLDLDIDDYATFNWKAVADAINILGGIDVEISKAELYYINAFITETVKATGVYSVHLKKTGMNHLDGVQAVAYGRLRLMDTDYNRTERQRKVIELAFEKFKKADWVTINNVIQTIYPQVSTSVQLNDLVAMGRTLPKFHMGESTGFPNARGEAKIGKRGDCVIPQTLEKNVIELHKFLFGDENYTPTDTVRVISKKIISDTGLSKEVAPAGKSGTGGGSVPKTTEAAGSGEKRETDSAGKLLETEAESGGTRESSAHSGKPSESETDSQGNLIFPVKESESGTHKPTQGETGSSTAHPGLTEESSPAPGSTGNNTPGGSTSGGTSGGTTPGGSTSGGTSSGGSAPGGSTSGGTTPGGSSSGTRGDAPGSSTDTGIILPPGSGSSGTGNSGSNNSGTNNTPGNSGLSSGNVEYSGPSGN